MFEKAKRVFKKKVDEYITAGQAEDTSSTSVGPTSLLKKQPSILDDALGSPVKPVAGSEKYKSERKNREFKIWCYSTDVEMPEDAAYPLPWWKVSCPARLRCQWLTGMT